MTQQIIIKNREKLVNYFKANSNKWVSRKEILDETGISDNTRLRHMKYLLNNGSIQIKKSKEKGKIKLFKLADNYNEKNCLRELA